MSDKVFHSLDKIKKIGKRNLHFSIPLKRNSSLVSGKEGMMGVFMYDGRPIKFFHLRDCVYTSKDPFNGTG